MRSLLQTSFIDTTLYKLHRTQTNTGVNTWAI